MARRARRGRAGSARRRLPDEAPPRRRHLRAVPGALRAPPAGPRPRRRRSCRASGASSSSCCRSAARARARPTSAARPTGSSIVPQRPVRRLQDRGGHATRSCSPSSRSPRRPSRRSGSSSGRWSSSRPTTRSPPPSHRFGRRPGGRAGRHLLAGQGHGPVRPGRPGRPAATGAAGLVYDEDGVRAKWGVPPACDPGPAGARRRRGRRLSRAARLGRQVGRRRALAATARSRRSRARAADWDVPVRGAPRRWPRRSASARDEVLPLPDLARLRTDASAPRDVASTSSAGAARRGRRWEAFCDEVGLARLRSRPHRWLEEG